jgi:predicted alpha/beta superfamily hydrolase
MGNERVAPGFPPVTLRPTEVRQLETPDGRRFELWISLPNDYDARSTARHPVIYVTDGYWDMPTVWTAYCNLEWDRAVPSCLVVGLGYPDRDTGPRSGDLVPFELRGDPGSGQAGEFVAALESQVIPFVEREYRVDPSYRVLTGCSKGGLFVLYAMYARPGLFQGHVAVAPMVMLNRSWLLGYDDEFARSGRGLPTRLFFTAAEWDTALVRGAIERYRDRLEQRRYAGLAWEFRLVDGARHATLKPESLTRGLAFTLLPRAPETGPDLR